MTSSLPRLLELQRTRNAQTRDAWSCFDTHRQQIMGLLRPDASRVADQLGLLGAGNCNDVDLAMLRTQYRQVHLIDWDGAALDEGVRRQLGVADEGIIRHGGVDLTGIAGQLSDCRPELPPDEQVLGELRQIAASPALPLAAESADTVASLCVLSQLVELCVTALGSHHSRLADLIAAVRLGHLRQVARCLRPGGKGILVTDLVSSDTVPGLNRVTPEALPGVVHGLLDQGNFFAGLHPQAILGDFRADGLLGRRAGDLRVTSPWLWQMGPRTYAAFALIFRAR